MVINSVDNNVTPLSSKMRVAGSLTGTAVAGIHLMKNRNDVFINRVQESVAKYGTKKYGVIASLLSATIVTAGMSAVGALVGTVVGKVTEAVAKNKAQKEMKSMIANSVQEMIKNGDVEMHTVDDLEEFFGEADEEAVSSSKKKLLNNKNIALSILAALTAGSVVNVAKNKIPTYKDEDVSPEKIEQQVEKNMRKLVKEIQKQSKGMTNEEFENLLNAKLGSLSFPQAKDNSF